MYGWVEGGKRTEGKEGGTGGTDIQGTDEEEAGDEWTE